MSIVYLNENGCWVCGRCFSNSRHPDICNECTDKGYLPRFDPDEKTGFWKTLKLIFTHRPYFKQK